MMSENNLKFKITSKEQHLSQNTNLTFDQHKFISDIYECEKQKYILEKRYNAINNSIKRKRIKPEYWNTNFSKNEHKECKKMKPKPFKAGWHFYFTDSLLRSGIKGVIAGTIFSVLHIIVHSVLRKHLNLGSYELGFGLLFAIIITVVLVIRDKVSTVRAQEAEEFRYRIECDEVNAYNEKIKKYNKEVSSKWNDKYVEYCNDLDKKADEYEKLMKPEIEVVKSQYRLVCDTLKSLYELRINGTLCLHPNYRGLASVSIIYGYFDTGRCVQLQGHEGAYNLYEDEKMKGMIINKLDVVSKQLSKLNSTMVYVGQAIQECNERLSDLESASNRMISSVNTMNSNVSNRLNGVSNQMSAIEANTANSAYYSEVGARMSAFNTVYNMLKD